MTDLEKLRRENIKRNQGLLKKLNLDALNQSIADDVRVKKELTKPKRRPKAPPKEPAIPTRRSRRLAAPHEWTEEEQKINLEEERARERQEKLKALRLLKLTGDFTLGDLILDRQLGHLKHEERVLDVKDEPMEDAVKDEDTDEVKVEEPDIKDEDMDSDNLDFLLNLGEKYSAGDFFEQIKQREQGKSLDLKKVRKEFEKVELYRKVSPASTKASYNRITTMHFHPAETDRLVSAGDTNGSLGLWSVDESTEDGEAQITILKPHGRSISKIIHNHTNAAELLTSSYDGSVRKLDIKQLKSTEVLNIDVSDDLIGVSDINVLFAEPNLLHLTTLEGRYYQHDMRLPFKGMKNNDFLRLHDKKIGGFTVSPNLSYQIATASLDRTLRVWDLRNVSKANSLSEFEKARAPHLYGSYTSRLSISTVDWNSNDHLVCNGYDDRIKLFDFSGNRKPYTAVQEWAKNYQPEVRKKTDSIPDNLKPFNSITHNCQTGRWVSILKAKWQKTPADQYQKFAIANMNRSIDVYDESGNMIAHLNDEEMTAVPASVAFHPSQNWVVGGTSSGKLNLFT
ncbi:hypothetical protein C7M61_002044 [Candidozyma pseudohaemuli]|uniref:DNA damage-binding protein CMR1 n=1 Tax=Candidozyma pseudohaemuli TaxID=418784 RepID=A0A2P7YU13_9ASCO|nr:hypothetical protein C7M61_002044 [[Candida] pseudohaemulonii]PSK39432.1 hypothetical protein C7M61_002044 [[Candida] pseudohaemulonii]